MAVKRSRLRLTAKNRVPICRHRFPVNLHNSAVNLACSVVVKASFTVAGIGHSACPGTKAKGLDQSLGSQ